MTETSNVVNLPTKEKMAEMKRAYFDKLRSQAAQMLQQIAENPPAHVLVIALSPDDADPEQDVLSVASTLPLANPRDMQAILSVLNGAAQAITQASGMPEAQSMAEDGE